MPVDRALAEGLAQALVDLYGNAEQAIVSDLARRLKNGIDAPGSVSEKLASINDLRNALQQLVRKLDADTEGLAHQAITLAFGRGGQAALAELARIGGLNPTQLAALRASLPGAEAINRLVFSLVSTLRGTHVRILRWPLDAYREVLAATLPQVLLGTTTRLRAAQVAWERLIERGITGFVDKAGRNWALTSYVEMATRTGAAQAAVQGHLDRLGAAGIDLTIVSDAVQECERCRPWEGKILSRTIGGRRTVEVEHATVDGRMVRVDVAGSVVEAVAKGLLHPNCRHSLSAYLPGLTKAPTNTEDPEGDKARQRQRALERKIRKAKLQALGALDPAAKRLHEARVRQAQANLRDHLAEHPELKRLRYREQIGAGNIPPRQPASSPPAPPEPRPDQLDVFDQPAEPEPPPDIASWTDEELEAGIVEHADNDALLDALLAELDRRQAESEPAPDAGEDPDAEKWARFDELVAEGVGEQEAYAEAFGKDLDRVRRDDAIQRLRADGYRGRGFDELAGAAYADAIERDYFAAEAATNGFLLTAAGQRAGLDPRQLWRQNETYARKWASNELKEWWDQNGRLTFDEFSAQLLSGSNERRFRTGGESWLQ